MHTLFTQEEYSIARNHWGLSMADLSEVARNSVLQVWTDLRDFQDEHDVPAGPDYVPFSHSARQFSYSRVGFY